jgi:hypothetical protein
LEIIKKYTDGHPSFKSKSAPFALLLGLQESFPCH